MTARSLFVGGMWLVALATGACTSRDADSTNNTVATPTDTGQLAIDSLLAAGDLQYKSSPDSARVLWSFALTRAEELGDSVRMARALTGLGQAAYRRGAYDTARTLGERALAMKLRLGMTRELFRSYNSLGLIAWDQERLPDATALFQRAIASARLLGDSLGVAKATMNRGLVYLDLAQFEEAGRYLNDARSRLTFEGDSSNLGRTLTNLASLNIAVGDPQSAIAQLTDARRMFGGASDLVGELNARAQLATAYAALGDPRRAFSAIDSALDLATRLGDRADVAENLRIKADMYLAAGAPQHALEFYEDAAALCDSVNLREERAIILRNQARALHALGHTPRAYDRAAEALREHQRGGFEYSAMRDRLMLAELAQQLGRTAAARAHLQAARRFAAEIRLPVASAHVALVAARVASMQSQWRDVIRELDVASSDIRLVGSDAAATQFALRARAHARLGNTQQAIVDGRAAIAAVEQIREGYDTGELRTLFIASKSSVYADLALVLLAANQESEAFSVADAARGRAILEHLSSARASLRRDPGTDQLANAEALLKRIDALVSRLRESEQSSPRERSPEALTNTRGLRDSLRHAQLAYDEWRARSAHVNSPVARIIAPPAASLRQTQSALASDELLLEYFATEKRLLIFAVSATAFRLIELPVAADSLALRVSLARDLTGRRGPHDFSQSVLSALYATLISPVNDAGLLKNVRSLVVIPHGLLTYLPFAALMNPKAGRFLIDDVNVLVAPSAAVLTTMRSSNSVSGARGRDARAWPPVYALAPSARQLQGSLEELRGIRASIPSVRSVVGNDASERALRSMLQDDAIVHIASHAYMNSVNPQYSRVELAPGVGGATDDNARLEVHEILGLTVRSPLVFLSGCETAVGSDWAGGLSEREDFTSLAHAWLVAGARNVVATLWRIDDRAAAEFARHFYRALPGTSVAEALAQAQRTMIKDPRFSQPYFWAAYQAVGDGRAFSPSAVGMLPENRLANRARLSVSR